MSTLVRVMVRGGTAAAWTAANPVLLLDELGYEEDTGRLKIGDGAAAWNALGYQLEGPWQSITTTEALAAGDICNIYSTGGNIRVRKANATDLTKPANGFVRSAALSGAAARVRFVGQVVTGLAGLTPGATYFLHTAGGAVNLAAPSADGNGVQEVGLALSATTLLFHPKPMIGL